MDQLQVGQGPECTNSPQEAPHYHAKGNASVRAIDGTTINDPGGCGFGKVDQVTVEEVEISPQKPADNHQILM